MAPSKWPIVFAFIVFLTFSSVLSIDIHVTGPHETISGDYEKFTCDIKGEGVTSNYGFEWKFKLKNGDFVSMNDSDIITALEIRNFSPESLKVTSFLRTDSSDIMSVICQHSPKISGSLDIDVKDLTAITADNDPCAEAEKSGKSVVSVFMPSVDMLLPSYRKSHYIRDQYVLLTNYGLEVSEIKLTCHSPLDLNPRWSIKKEVTSKMKYAAWAEQSLHQACKQQVLHIYQVAGESGQITNLTFDCMAGEHSSKINLGLAFPLTRSGMDLNATENCINQIVEQFYSKELTGVGVASSFVIVLMMAGIAVLKRQLNQQQSINKDLQQPKPVGNGSNGASSTEQLNPQHSQNNGNNTAYP